MANRDNVLDGLGPSLLEAVDDEDDDGNQQPSFYVPPWSVNSSSNYDVLSWGQPRTPLRRPFSFRNHLAEEEPESPEKTTSDSPVDSSRAPNPSVSRVPVAEDSVATAQYSLATAEVKSSEGPAGWKGMGHNPINVPQEFPGGPSSLAMGGIRFTSGDTRIGGNNARYYVPLPPGPWFCVPRGPPITAPPYNPTIRSGIMMQQPPEWRMACNEGRVYVPFPVGGPRYPMENHPRPITFPTCIGRFPPPTEVPQLPRPVVFPTRPPGFAAPQIIPPAPPSRDTHDTRETRDIRDTGFPSWCKKRMEDNKK